MVSQKSRRMFGEISTTARLRQSQWRVVLGLTYDAVQSGANYEGTTFKFPLKVKQTNSPLFSTLDMSEVFLEQAFLLEHSWRHGGLTDNLSQKIFL